MLCESLSKEFRIWLENETSALKTNYDEHVGTFTQMNNLIKERLQGEQIETVHIFHKHCLNISAVENGGFAP